MQCRELEIRETDGTHSHTREQRGDKSGSVRAEDEHDWPCQLSRSSSTGGSELATFEEELDGDRSRSSDELSCMDGWPPPPCRGNQPPSRPEQTLAASAGSRGRADRWLPAAHARSRIIPLLIMHAAVGVCGCGKLRSDDGGPPRGSIDGSPAGRARKRRRPRPRDRGG